VTVCFVSFVLGKGRSRADVADTTLITATVTASTAAERRVTQRGESLVTHTPTRTTMEAAAAKVAAATVTTVHLGQGPGLGQDRGQDQGRWESAVVAVAAAVVRLLRKILVGLLLGSGGATMTLTLMTLTMVMATLTLTLMLVIYPRQAADDRSQIYWFVSIESYLLLKHFVYTFVQSTDCVKFSHFSARQPVAQSVVLV
jgi:hypothetical protein